MYYRYMKTLDEIQELANEMGLCINLKFFGETAYVNGSISYENQLHVIKRIATNRLVGEFKTLAEVDAFVSGYLKGVIYN